MVSAGPQSRWHTRSQNATTSLSSLPPLCIKSYSTRRTHVRLRWICPRACSMKETVLCAGAYLSPQLLLSGVDLGSPRYSARPRSPCPRADSARSFLYWELKERGSAMDADPDAKLSAPQFYLGLPADWMENEHETSVLSAAQQDGADDVSRRHLSHPERCHTEIFFAYVPAGPGARKYKPDGKTMTSMILSISPTSRGSVTLASADPSANPIIDPNCYATEADHVAIRTQGPGIDAIDVHRPVRRAGGIDRARWRYRCGDRHVCRRVRGHLLSSRGKLCDGVGGRWCL